MTKLFDSFLIRSAGSYGRVGVKDFRKPLKKKASSFSGICQAQSERFLVHTRADPDSLKMIAPAGEALSRHSLAERHISL